ncbi:helix-turn-helix DNA binding protein [Mycobacterium phage Mangethe]|uniref:Helix-turn-helix DNA binding protein n=1 Tax=Mycobacterium phage Majeke TaxID=2024296 RepID=A0A249XTM9_9CAUD|nr:Arc-like repressor [Mycobacterium phage Majeke]ASZ75340.1 helix-turn-helix DNA binding protein [Mycobacterium phage Majeke]AYQ99889.1 helix-turn-helix DNA binding protein [Mycobacterium phage Mangethe]QBI98018.1 helix-turn-helix DNA binding protein [Mycobacterium phage Zilizebeth]URP21066.1 helix-turn-helix DNA binding domain protein [Mycobacterium phage Phegasus]
MPREPLRAIRISDELWQSVRAKADAEGSSANAVIRELLERWVTRPPRNQKG